MAEEIKNKFTTSTGDIDRDKLLDLVAKNAEGYAQWRLSKLPGRKAILKKNRLEAFDTNAFQSALKDVTSAISDGKVSREAGNVYVNSDGTVWDDDYHRAALDLVDRGISAMSTTAASNKTKLGTDRIKNRFNNKFYGGNFTGSEADWDRWKDNPNAAVELADMIDEELADIDANDYDYEGSAYKDKDDYRKRLSKLSTNLRNGTLDNSDIADWNAIGGDSTFFRNVVGLKKPEAPEVNPYEEEWAKQEKDLIQKGVSAEGIAKIKEDYWKKLQTVEGVNDDNTLYQKAYEDFANNNWLDTADSEVVWNNEESNKDAYDNDAVFGKIEENGSKTPGFLSNNENLKKINDIINNIYNGISPNEETLSWNSGTWSIPRVVRTVMKKEIQDKNKATRIGNTNSYYINETLNLDKGSVLRYDAGTNKFVRVYFKNNPKKKAQLLSMLLNAYREKNPLANGQSGASSNYGSIIPTSKHGSKLEKMKELRNIPKAFNGLELVAKEKKRQELEFLNFLSLDAIARYGDDSEESKQKALLGNQRALSTESTSAKNGVKNGLDNSDWLRLGSALTDIASIGASYTGAGMPVAGLMQLGSTAMDFAADIGDDTVDTGQAVLNLGKNLGLGVATMFGAGAVAKAGKIGKLVARLFPVALSGMGAVGILGDKDFQSAIKKMGNGNMTKMTTNEWKSMTLAIKIFAGGHFATKSAAGQLGVDFGRTSKLALAAGKWGNNAWSGGNKKAYLRAVAQGGFKRGATVPSEKPTVKIGGLEVNRVTAKEMAKAAKDAAKKPNATADDIKNAMLEAYRKSDEGKTNITKIPGRDPGEITIKDAADETGLKTFLGEVGKNKKIGKMAIDDDTDFNFGNGAPTVKGADLTTGLQAVYDAAASKAASGDAAAKHSAGLLAVNDILKLWKTPDTETGIPNFTFDGIKPSGSKWDLTRFFGKKVNIEDDAPGLLRSAKNKISPKRKDMFDPTTVEGRQNLRLLGHIRNPSDRIPGLTSDLEFNMGMGWRDNYLNRYLLRKIDEYLDTKEPTTSRTPSTPATPGNVVASPSTPASPSGGTSAPITGGSAAGAPTTPPPATGTTTPATGGTPPPTPKPTTTTPSTGRTRATNKPTPKPTPRPLLTKEELLEFYKLGRTDREFSGMSEFKLNNLKKSIDSVKAFDGKNHLEVFKELIELKQRGFGKSFKDVIKNIILRDNDNTLITDPVKIERLKIRGLFPEWATEIYRRKDGQYAFYRLGGRLEQLKALRMGFTADDSYTSDELSKFANGGIIKAQDGSVADWYKKRYSHQLLNGYKPELRTDYAGSTITDSGKHHMDNEKGDLTNPFKTNQAYTADSNAVGSDLLSYYDSDTYDNINDFVSQYNLDADKIRGTWENDHSVNETGAKSHNLLFKKMFTKRSGTGTDYGLGYDESSEDILGSTTWQRRMDLYERKFGDTNLTDDERKKRIHKINLKNGTTGYVYKEDNGDIGIVDNDTLTRLGITLPSTNTNPATEKIDTKGGGKSQGDGGGIVNLNPLGRSLEFNNFLNEVKAGLPNTLATTRLINNLRNNRKVAEMAKLKQAVTLAPIQKHRDVYGDFASLQLSKALGANYHRMANNVANNTANSELAALARFEGLDKYNTAEMQGRSQDNAMIAKTKEAANTVADLVYDYNHKAGDENMARFVAKYNADIDADMGKQAANTTNWESYLMGLENEARTKKVDDRTRQLAYYSELMNNYIKDATENTPEYLLMMNEYRNTTDSTKANELLKKMQNYKADKTKEILPVIRKLRQNYILGNYNINDIPIVGSKDYTFNTNPNGEYPMILKKGAKIDSSRMRYRSEDLKELRKQIRHNIDTNRKALDNLSKATLLELKKAMGI